MSDRDRLIELLKEADDATDVRTCNYPDQEKAWEIFYTSIANYLLANGVTVEQKQDWIPCSERLPSFCPRRRRCVLVTVEDLDGERFVTTAKYHEGFNEWGNFKDPRYYDFKVIAWQPLPEPYVPDTNVGKKSCETCDNNNSSICIYKCENMSHWEESTCNGNCRCCHRYPDCNLLGEENTQG